MRCEERENLLEERSECLSACASVSLISHHRFFSPLCSANQEPANPLPVFSGRTQETAGVEDVHVNSPGMQWMNPTLQAQAWTPEQTLLNHTFSSSPKINTIDLLLSLFNEIPHRQQTQPGNGTGSFLHATNSGNESCWQLTRSAWKKAVNRS